MYRYSRLNMYKSFTKQSRLCIAIVAIQKASIEDKSYKPPGDNYRIHSILIRN